MILPHLLVHVRITDFEFENKTFVRFELFVFQEKNLYLRD